MSSDRELNRIVRSWLEEGVNALPDRVLDDVLAELPVTSQRRPWWRAWRKTLMNSTFKFAVVGAVALVVAVVAFAVYFNRPSGPAATATPGQSQAAVSPTNSPTIDPAQSTQPTQIGDKEPWVVFQRGDGRFGTPDDLWAMHVDGSDAHEIMTGLDFPNIAWSQDGRRLLVADSNSSESEMSRLYLSEVSDVIGPFVDLGFGTGSDTACIEKSRKPFPCQDWGLSFAPDGQRVVLLQTCTYIIPGCGFMTIVDLRTGELTELSETLQQGHRRAGPGVPAWSPDGSTMAFVQEEPAGDIDAVSDSKLYVMNADGSNIHEVPLTLPRVTSPQWSPDGTTLVFLSDIYSDESGETILVQDVYTVHPDGSDLRQLTTTGLSNDPEWTLSNEIRFRNGNDTFPTLTYALMDGDGGNLRPYADMAPLIGAIATSGSSGEYAVPGSVEQSFYWQPAE